MQVERMTLYLLGNFSVNFFHYQILQQILSGIPFQCQTVWIQILANILSVLIWVQPVCNHINKH